MYDAIRDLQLSKQHRDEMRHRVWLERRGGSIRGRGGSGFRWLAALAGELKIDVIRLKKVFGVLEMGRKGKEKS